MATKADVLLPDNFNIPKDAPNPYENKKLIIIKKH